ncbi:MAG: cellulase family glycosylhydrolase [Melioribacteraceae bacterium]|nr:cellulase family glycosylhydrolase [Melioribacteraceae bacterium]
MKNGKYLLYFFFLASIIFSQNNNNSGVYIDDSGIIRWKDSQKEVSLFGVNYTTPFAYSYRAHKRLGLSLKDAIDLDVAQMVRLGFNAFRVHVWDREITDKDGNIILNKHLDLLDYLLSKLAENGIKTIITPIAWWGTGWPEPDPHTDGFSQSYSKVELVTNDTARSAQRNYLKQFMLHKNKYNKFTYGTDPSIIAMEIINEPFHPENREQVTGYINEMVKVIRGTGYEKPIFYNISENWNDEQAQAVVNADIQGISFQWYPTGLVHNKMLDGNYLINVNKYLIPSENIKGFETKSRMIYEFDAADIGRSYMYPAMARSFREAGMQFATMFSYDPVQIAWSNTEYPTHFANLLYTPSKAIGLMLASKVFQLVPRSKSFGEFPANNQFEDFSIRYEEDLSELNNDSLFIYTNNTKSEPKNIFSLKQIAGVGSSPFIKYDGTGAYFLDKIDEKVWQLEVYPDVLWLRDPFEQTSLSRQVARLFWNEREMKISLPDLKNNFTVYPLENRNAKKRAESFSFNVTPGVYILSQKNEKEINKYLSRSNKFLKGIYMPSGEPANVYVVNRSPQYMYEEKPAKFEFDIASERKIKKAELFIKRSGWRGYAKYPLKNSGGFRYLLADSLKTFEAGKIEFCVVVETEKGIISFPDGVLNSPEKWDFVSYHFWETKILSSGTSIAILDIGRDKTDLSFPQFTKTMRYNLRYTLGTSSEKEALSVKINYTSENKIPFAIQKPLSKFISELGEGIDNYSKLVIKARSTGNSEVKIKLVFLTKCGKSYAAINSLNNQWQENEIHLDQFKKNSSLIMPFSYPKFLPKTWFGVNKNDEKFKLSESNLLQIICDNDSNGLETGFEIESIFLK